LLCSQDLKAFKNGMQGRKAVISFARMWLVLEGGVKQKPALGRRNAAGMRTVAPSNSALSCKMRIFEILFRF